MPNTRKITLIVADDHDLYRDGLISLLAEHQGYRVAAGCADADQLLRAVRTHKPDVVITDLKMPGTPMMEVIRTIREQHPFTNILALTVMDNEYQIARALECGAKGYLTKDAPRSDVLHAIDAVHRNLPYYCRFTTGKLTRLISSSFHQSHTEQVKATFSDTEKKVIRLICEDRSVREMAAMLCLSERTVEKHRSVIFEKMKVKTAGGVAIYAIRHQLYIMPEHLLQ